MNGGANSMEPLRVFRDRFYAGLGRRADALFELCDAILTAGRVPSPPHLSLVSVHRRGWGSLYAALSKGRIDSEALRDLLASYDLDAMGTPVYAVDVSPWPRCDAEASPGRCYLYHPSRHSAGQPIVAGWGSGERRWQLRVWVCWACGGYGVTRRLKKASLLGTRLRKETAMSEANKALGRREIEEIFNGSNLDAADEIYASDFVDHDRAFSWEMHGPEEMKEYVGIFHSAFPDFRVTLEDQIAEGDKVVNRWTVQGTHRGEFQGVAPTGKEVEFTGMHVSHINEEGKLQESWQNYDALGLTRQIGAFPAPE